MIQDTPAPAAPGRAAAHPPQLRGLPLDLVRDLERLGDLEVVLLALWRALWKRHRWDDGVVLAVGLDGSQRAGDGVVPMRVPLAVGLADDPTFAELVGRTVGDLLAAQARAAAPKPQGTLLDGAAYAFDYGSRPVGDANGVRAERGAGGKRGDRPTLALVCMPHGGGVVLEVLHDAERFHDDEVRRVLARFETLARSAAATPDLAVSRLELLPPGERHRVLVEFNDTAVGSVPEVAMPALIADSVRRDPEAPAVLAGEHELTYGDLERRATRLAARLRAAGIGRNDFVAVHAEPSPGMVVGLVAVLKAGAAYLPLDPEYPADRLAFMMEDSGARVLLTQRHLRPIGGAAAVERIVLDDGGRPLEGGPGEADELEPELDPGLEARPDDLAYLIYTSGSTGRPKGVRVSHRNLVHSTLARDSYYGGRVGRFLLLSSFAFDSSVAGLFWTLVDGGALVLPPAGAHRDPRRIGELMARHGVTHTLCLASHWRLILAGAEDGAFACLDTSIVSGEVFSSELVLRHDQRAPGTRLFNEYGPTEGSVWSVVFDCHDDYPGNRVPIGRPIANTRIYLLDEHRHPVPIGVAGEMYQGGAGVAQGYLNRPELTAERFVPDPFSDEQGARLYRAGDLARYLPGGDMIFLGRVDDQVKIRGYRIELGEIEAVLGGHDAVREAAVICRRESDDDQRLVAYVALEPGAALGAAELRAWLAEKLPAYMLPAATVFVDALPRTSIGKLEPESLPAPPRARPDTGVDFEAAATPLERVLAAIWAAALDLEQVGRRDDFFALGGHSVLAIRVMSQVRAALGAEPPMRAFFEHPTVAALAAVMAADTERCPGVERRAELLESVDELSGEQVEEALNRRARG